ncbi:hypothetical protein BDW42DRAFT_54515 [Aspergillus taichungensis]|uniref:Uncharacterized protein n=1 Tax=Aspergillus taichungensis TaxID=482145 RepID=A0A2J5HD39_9EURO|nr:hypothetical protein BDW42DRAFT_54515 [Aspergillus taichungensis]
MSTLEVLTRQGWNKAMKEELKLFPASGDFPFNNHLPAQSYPHRNHHHISSQGHDHRCY